MTAFPKPQGRVRDADYLTRVHELPCFLRAHGGCRGRIEANHMGNSYGHGALSRKADDRTCVPMCSAHHEGWTIHRGYFPDFVPIVDLFHVAGYLFGAAQAAGAEPERWPLAVVPAVAAGLLAGAGGRGERRASSPLKNPPF